MAILARAVFIESVGRYRAIFEQTSPSRFAQFTERVPMGEGQARPKSRDGDKLRLAGVGASNRPQ